MTLSMYLLVFVFCRFLFGPISDAIGRPLNVVVAGLGIFAYWVASFVLLHSAMNANGLAERFKAFGGVPWPLSVTALVKDGMSINQVLPKTMSMIMLVMAPGQPWPRPILGGAYLNFWSMAIIFSFSSWAYLAMYLHGVIFTHASPETLPPDKAHSFLFLKMPRVTMANWF